MKNRLIIPEQDRHQIEILSMEDMVANESPVRLVDAFVERLDLDKLGFTITTTRFEGRPSFRPQLFLKLYLYGYLNGIRSSRRLERECGRNIEAMWLLGRLVPNYHSIADFRKDNPQALKNTFKLFVLFLKDSGLVSGKTVAIDGSKFRASNSKKNNYNPKKIARHLKYIEEKSAEYLAELDKMDKEETTPVKIQDIKAKLDKLSKSKLNYELIGQKLEQSGEPQLSTTDPDARALLVQGQVVEVSYNMEVAVDEKHKLPIATHVINRNDRNALHDIAIEAKQNVGEKEITAISDKGFHNGRELEKCKTDHIITICAQPEVVNSNEYGTTPDYLVSQFKYDKENDTYTCPAGQILKTKGTWHKKTRERDSYNFKKYRTPACKGCPVKHLCTGKAKGGREIERSEFAQAIEENAARYRANKELYRKRQEWNEHIFGTIKRKWGYIFTDLRGLKKVNGELNLIMTVYNFRRCISILGHKDFLEKIKKWTPDYSKILPFFKNMAHLLQLWCTMIFRCCNISPNFAIAIA